MGCIWSKGHPVHYNFRFSLTLLSTFIYDVRRVVIYIIVVDYLVDDQLKSWSEDNVTLGMSKKSLLPKNSFIPFLSYIINIVFIFSSFDS